MELVDVTVIRTTAVVMSERYGCAGIVILGLGFSNENVTLSPCCSKAVIEGGPLGAAGAPPRPPSMSKSDKPEETGAGAGAGADPDKPPKSRSCEK